MNAGCSSPWVDVTGGDSALQEHDTFLDNEVLRHVYPLWPCPEGKEARQEIAEIIRNS